MKNMKLNYPENIDDLLNIEIVNQFKNYDYQYFYRSFDIKNPVKNIGLIGVGDGDDFAIKFQRTENIDFAMAVYLDGVNVSQKQGIKSLSSIEEFDRDNYDKHVVFLSKNHNTNPSFLDRYSQKNGENRKFVFTTKENHGINEILINDASKKSRIDIYLWSEEKYDLEEDGCVFYDPGEESLSTYNSPKKVKIGAGDATNESFKSSAGLINPVFMGKLMFIYLHENEIKHLGTTKLPKNYHKEFDFDDPMDNVPVP